MPSHRLSAVRALSSPAWRETARRMSRAYDPTGNSPPSTAKVTSSDTLQCSSSSNAQTPLRVAAPVRMIADTGGVHTGEGYTNLGALQDTDLRSEACSSSASRAVLRARKKQELIQAQLDLIDAEGRAEAADRRSRGSRASLSSARHSTHVDDPRVHRSEREMRQDNMRRLQEFMPASLAIIQSLRAFRRAG